MTLTDQQVLDIVNEQLAKEGIYHDDHLTRLGRLGRISPALQPLIDRYLTITRAPRACQVEHDHWEGKMICGNPLPCLRHGG